ncbi:hypothetical protein HOO54_15460 [Bacillus sp. WMMC1349]|uniref:hypothetical protein n=1 Tax=Bacillus sp. WMMC1349 TaxID=2736254 RepID=UPI001553140F|nr:hypothetical protein [Bacillus sp. WMMC1349]NPC93596.1 hypothetical protein [Bacillus sp. WMMC1349]
MPSFFTPSFTKAGEQYLNKKLKGNGHKIHKAKYGKRVVDVYVIKTNWAHESKVSYATKTKFIKKQIDKDVWLKRVDGVEWHFFKSAKTGKIGASKPILNYLKKNKIHK